MLSITRDPCMGESYLDFAKNSNAFTGCRVTGMTSFQHQDTDITIMTEEGDRVTLSAESRHEESYFSYRGLIFGDGAVARLQEKSYTMQANEEISITVEGNLSEQELQDIQDSIKTIDKVMQAVLTGNMEHALAMINEVTSLDSISGFSAAMEIENMTSFEQQTTIEAQTKVPGSMEDLVLDQGAVSYKGLDTIVDKIMDSLEQQGVTDKKFIDPLDRYFSKLSSSILEKFEGRERSDKMGKTHHIHSELMERMGERAHGRKPVSHWK